MTDRVKAGLAKRGDKRSNRVVKSAKVETKIDEVLKRRFAKACQKRSAVMSVIVRDLIVAFCEAVEGGSSPDAPFEVRTKSHL